ncbi:hypothetical protein RP20_CCG014514 [Aedes albopictus]|nr:hypothetical protein RP20_CCG014514 [Aedes albopictus]
MKTSDMLLHGLHSLTRRRSCHNCHPHDGSNCFRKTRTHTSTHTSRIEKSTIKLQQKVFNAQSEWFGWKVLAAGPTLIRSTLSQKRWQSTEGGKHACGESGSNESGHSKSSPSSTKRGISIEPCMIWSA